MQKAALLFMAGAAIAHKSAHVINPCPDCPTNYQVPSVTITKEYQIVPTCAPKDGKILCHDYPYVHTTVKDAYGHKTVTDYKQPIALCHTKTKVPITTTYTAAGSYATESVYFEDYEKSCEAPYNHVGPINGLPGYKGSGLCGKKCQGEHGAKYQPMTIKECWGKKCKTYHTTYTHAAPEPMTTSYDAPGTYTVSDYDVTVTEPYTSSGEAHVTCHAGESVTYGGMSTSVSEATTVTAAYPTYSAIGNKFTKSYIATTTYTCPSAGEYTIVDPTTTAYPSDTTVTYPTYSVYPTGVYHHSAETITVTKSGEHYTCTLGEHPTSTSSYPSYPEPSSGYEEPSENYGRAESGYGAHGGVIKRAGAGPVQEDAWAMKRKRVVLV